MIPARQQVDDGDAQERERVEVEGEEL